MENEKIAFIPGAFRPFGDHHLKMVKHYSDLCDKVVLVVSNPSGKSEQRLTNKGISISPEDAKQIIELCLSDYGLDNVICQIQDRPNPIKTILKDIALLKNCSVMIGVGSKDDDENRFNSLDLDFFKNNGVTILPPSETAFECVENDGISISASDIRKHIDDESMLRSYLPVSIEDDTFQKIYDILNGEKKNRLDTKDELRLGSQIFQNLLEEEKEKFVDDSETEEIDEEETEFSDLQLNDENLEHAKCSLIAYNTHILEDDDEGVYTPKSNPDKAIDILFEFENGNKVEIYLDTNTKEWNSNVNGYGRLTPDQMGQFFRTNFSKKVDNRIFEMWPERDPYFKELLGAVRQKKVCCEPCGLMTEDGEFRKGNIDKSRSRGKNAAGEQIYTNSGRKIVSFSDFGVKHSDEEAYFVWPEKNKEFKWSQWADWRKIHPLVRMRFKHLSYLYGISMSPLAEDDKNRGFRSYNLDLEPKLQYCTPIETQQMMDLTIVQKFLRNAYRRLKRFVDMSDEEIFKRIGRPDKCSIGDIRRTKHVIHNSMKAIRERRADTYIYT